jgi:protein O-GlcNAc transferase
MLKNLLNRLRPAPPAPVKPVAAPAAPPAAGDIALADRHIADGNRLEDAGDLEGAERLYRQAVQAAQGHARAHLNLGIVLAARGDNAGATQAYETVLAIDRQHPFGNYNFGRLAFLEGDLAKAERLLREALRAKPDFPQALVVLASVLDALEKPAAAIESLESALRLRPADAGAWFNLAVLLLKLKRSDDAEVAARHLLELEPAHAAGQAMLGRLLREHGFVPPALELLREAIRNDPANLAFQSQELMLLNCEEDVSAAELFRWHVEYGARTEQAFPARFERFPGSADPSRRLRVGYVSGDFCLHPVTLFLMPVLERHDRAGFEVFCYSTGDAADHVTQRVREHSDHWLDAQRMSDAELADAIHADAIDILVDLTGHSNVPRLAVFSQRPAPVQATWLGYLNTTGLTRMDYRLSDSRCDPADVSQTLHTERLVALPNSQWCYRPFLESTLSESAPLERNGHVTFGSFNSALKITPAMCRRWCEVLRRVPGSRLLVADVKSDRKRAAIRQEMASAGIAEDRVEFLARVDLDKYPDLVSRVDIALDTFPYGGGTTTFDALWMGVPVVTAVGPIPVARSASSILAQLDLDAWIAPRIEDFVDVVVARASDRAAIVSLRHALRPRLQASPLTDEARFVRDLESAYREMWAARRP